MTKKLLMCSGAVLFLLVILLSAGAIWISDFTATESELEQLRATRAQDISYIQNSLPATRGRILAVVTSARRLGDTGRPTGYELTELARAYWVFTANGFEVDIASPLGGEPYALLDTDDMGAYDYAFLNDAVALQKTRNTTKVTDVSADDYQAIYFVGGKGAMFDFPDNAAIQHLVASFIEQGKIVAAVCHGPAALVNVKTAQGEWLVTNKMLSAFTNSEELLLIPDARAIFPFLLQSKLEERGATFAAGPDYLEQVSISGGLVTGQNPWSVWRLAEEMIRLLGYEPLSRSATPEENTVALLAVYQRQGLAAAEKFIRNNPHEYQGTLAIMHSIVAFMRWDLLGGTRLIILAESLRPKS